jgi:hypothetical protein
MFRPEMPVAYRFPANRSELCRLTLVFFIFAAFMNVTAAWGQAVTLSPTSISFGSVVVGTTSGARNVTLTNSGTATLTITSIAASGSFAQTNTCGSSVLAGKKCTISVTFAPTVTGATTGAVTITDNAANSPQTVGLTGTGVLAVTLSPATLTFASRTVGTTSSAQTITLTNNMATALTISSVTVSGDFAQTNTCGISVASKGKCTISVTFTPTVTGTRTGKVTVTDNAGNSPQTASLTGTGSTSGLTSIAITPANPSVAVGATQQFTATGTFNTGEIYNLTQSVNWGSTKTSVATISNATGTQGLATAVAVGTSTIKATAGGITGQTTLTVTSAPTLTSITIAPALPSITVGSTLQFTATGTYSDGSTQVITTTVTWASVSTAVATVSNASGTQGLATGVAVGTSTITATLGTVNSSTTLTVNAAATKTSITTYHYDNYRTGWNQNETSLTPANVNSSSFGLLATVALDNQVDAQPLVVPGVNITAGNYQGVHDVVYLATENDTVYAIDAESGTILLSPNFGPAVEHPGGCIAPYDGVNSTPVIDLSSNTMYVMVFTNQESGLAYYLHALDLGSLTDKVSPVLVSASHVLTDGSTYNFSAASQRQRPGLVLANGNVYAGFGAFCEDGGTSRGWLIGWQTGTLTPMTAVELTDTQASDADDYYSTALWMSGAAPAVDDSGNLLYVTGNSDPNGLSYNSVTNLAESVVKQSGDLTTVVDYFTPSNVATLDEIDGDFGAGGVMVLPDQLGTYPHLAVAAGKFGQMYLMDEDNLGGFSTKTNNVLGAYSIGKCWCGESYYVDPTDMTSRVVTSGGTTGEVWKLLTAPTTSLTMVTSASVSGPTGQSGGFFTSVSSNGTQNPIIWAVTRPFSTTQDTINLVAFNPDAGGSTMSILFNQPAGTWPNLGNNSNLVPVVANGEVFVASYQQLQIFGLNTAKAKAAKKK